MTPPAAPSPVGAFLRAALLLGAVLLFGPHPALQAITTALRSAEAATAQNNFTAAATLLHAAAQHLPYDPPILYRSALADVSAQQFERAVQKLEQVAAIEGWSPTRRIALGDAFLGLNQRTKAIEHWELALTEAPGDPALLTRLATSYEALGRYPEAIDALSQLAQTQNGDPAALYRLCLLTVATTPEEAPARLSRLAELAPAYATVAQQLLNAVQEGQATNNPAYTLARVGFEFVQLQEWALAELALTRATVLDPTYPDAFVYLGLTLDRQEKDGLAAYETAVRLAPQSVLAQFFLGLYYRRVGLSEKALPYLKQANDLDPNNPAIKAEIGGAYASLGDLQQAAVWLTQAVQVNERDPAFWLLLARFYVDQNYQVAEMGLPAARQAVGLAPDDPAALDVLGYALVLTNDVPNGQKLLERALTLNPELPSLQLHWGLLQYQLGNHAAAETAWNRTLYLDPQGPYGNQALKALSTLLAANPP